MVCATLPFISVGDCTQKSEINISKDVVTKRIKETISSTISSDNTSIVNIANQQIVLVGFPPGCSANISQSTNFRMINKSNMSSSFSNTSMSNIASAINTELESQLKTTTDLGSSMGAQESLRKVQERVTNILTDTNSISQIQNSVTSAVNITEQGIKIYFADISQFKSSGGSCSIVINQNTVTDLQAEKAYSTIVNLLGSDVSLQEAASKLKDSVAGEYKGATSLTDSIGGVIKAYGMYIAIILVVGLIAFLFLGKSLFENPEAIKALSEAAKGMYYF